MADDHVGDPHLDEAKSPEMKRTLSDEEQAYENLVCS